SSPRPRGCSSPCRRSGSGSRPTPTRCGPRRGKLPAGPRAAASRLGGASTGVNREAERMADERSTGTARVKRGLAEMLRGGVIMDVVTAEQARIAEDSGAVAVMALERVPALIRSKGEAGTGNIVEAVRHLRSIVGDIAKVRVSEGPELYSWAKELRAPVELVAEVAQKGELPVPLFCAGGIATPADASLVMQLGAQAVFVGSGIFKSADPGPRAKAIVEAT